VFVKLLNLKMFLNTSVFLKWKKIAELECHRTIAAAKDRPNSHATLVHEFTEQRKKASIARIIFNKALLKN
jgi:hypothetical protein